MSKKVVVVTCFAIFSSVAGGVLGWFLGGMFRQSGPLANDIYTDGQIEYSKNLDIVKKVLKEANVESEDELENVDLVSLVDSKKVTLGDLVEYAEILVQKHEYVSIQGRNFAHSMSMGVVNNQDTYTTWIKNNDLFFKENISFSNNARFAERTYNFDSTKDANGIIPPKSLDNILEYYRSSENNKLEVDYTKTTDKTKKEKYYINSPDENIKSYSTTFGLSLFNPFNYDAKEDTLLKENDEYASLSIVNSKTEEEYLYETFIKVHEAGYKIDFTISPSATTNYGAYIYTSTRDASNIAKMKDRPTFEKLGVQLITNKKLEILSFHSDEFYQVVSNLVGNVPTSCSSDLVYSYIKEECKIPNYQEAIDYGKYQPK